MNLTATPFDAQTGELLPVYRDAYLRGDLARSSARAVEKYLSQDGDRAHATLTRWHQLGAGSDATATPTWVQKQLQFVRAQPVRFRHRALALVAVGALAAGASMAGTRLPVHQLRLAAAHDLLAAAPAAVLSLEAADLAAARTVLVHGRILDEAGQPLVGATVLRKGTHFGASTNATGDYLLPVPAGAATTLQYGYAGYAEQDVAVRGNAPVAVTLQPNAPAPKRRHWLFF
ncbi:carboxypeptidase-like regulatory domain-containing protein [Hymenobacter caeli]|uniref:Carboxypeptidase-like regulatory domain-containing protein n=1 Tax=Hymenobacter caeli TaxID=2735894 RepID=A0ABX2FMX7_9BACT|nr:carboxypeptidase-like regulatory domain-containing protein [Hymenobacter caeli]NRT18292.1 hypothetical protein [Hymenobacter caeli]